MALITVPQMDTLTSLRTSHGLEDRLSIEKDEHPYGIVRATWKAPGETRLGIISVYIKPDGSPFLWRECVT